MTVGCETHPSYAQDIVELARELANATTSAALTARLAELVELVTDYEVTADADDATLLMRVGATRYRLTAEVVDPAEEADWHADYLDVNHGR